MKISFILLLSVFIFLNTTFAQNQVFEKGKSYIDLSTGFGGYDISIQKGERSNSEKAIAFVLPLNYEYALLDQVGIGLHYRGNKYLSRDSLNRSSSKSNAFLISNNLHFINNSVLEIYLGISYGIAFYKYRATQNQEQVYIKGAGFSYLTYGGIKTYIAGKFGTNITLSYDNYSFDIYRFKVNDLNQIQNNPDNYNVNFSGIDLTVGLTYKISK